VCTVINDIKYGFRQLRKSPGFTVVAVLSLAFGIGANSAIFSIVDAVLLQPLPFPDSQRLVWFRETDLSHGEPEMAVSLPTFLDWRSQQRSFEDLVAYSDEEFVLTGGGEPERVPAAAVSAGFFPLLHAQLLLGRSFTSDEDRIGARHVIIISHSLWQRRFGNDPLIVGKAITLDGASYEIIGVAPPGFDMPSKVDLWVTLLPKMAEGLTLRGVHILSVIGRLKSGITLDQAETEMNIITDRIAQNDSSYADFGVRLTSLHRHLTGDVRPALLILLVAVGMVLMIACANVANLLLARGATRGHEITIRLAIGASRGRLVRQLLTESIILAAIGGAVGLLLAIWGTNIFLTLSQVKLPRLSEVELNYRIVMVTALIAIVTGLVFGLAPSLRAARADLAVAFQETSVRVTESRYRHWLGQVLVTSEVGMTLVLLVGAGLLINSLVRLLRVNPGFRPEKVVAFRLALPTAKYSTPHQQATFFQQLIERVQTLPGVRSVGATRNLPMSGQSMTSPLFVEGRPETSSDRRDFVQFATIHPGYFHTLAIPLLRGRDFNNSDTSTMPSVAIINEALARRFFPGEDPIGRKLRTGFGGDAMREIVGVVGDVRHGGLAVQAPPQVYEPFLQHPEPFLTVVVSTDAEPSAVVAGVRGIVRSLDKDQPIAYVTTLEELLANSVARPRFYTLLLGVFTAMAFTLAAVGIYGVVAYSVVQRTREIGLRMVLGARNGDVLRLVIRQGMIPTLLGLGVGLVGAVVLTRYLVSLLYDIRPIDPFTFASATALFAGVALLACWLPARRAVKIDPMEALRYE
jgi:putative ABC transport system permease protein